jgi:hypothetical protein
MLARVDAMNDGGDVNTREVELIFEGTLLYKTNAGKFVAPDTLSPPRVVAPLTLNVPMCVAAPFTLNVPTSVVGPLTLRD